MASIALSLPYVNSGSKAKTSFSPNHALSFMNSIESTWKGNEQFAMWLIEKRRPKTIVDLGFDKGLSTIAFAYHNFGNVFGIDWFEDGNYAEKSFALDAAFSNISDAIRLNYAKNIHLIIGPFAYISKNWKKKVDILHIDWAHSYRNAKQHLMSWSKFLKSDSVILMHDVLAFPDGAGRAFQEIPLPKLIISNPSGLGVACADLGLLKEIRKNQKTIEV